MASVGPNVDGDVPPERILKSHEAEVAAHALARRRAVPVIAGRAIDADDCRELLHMLGLADVAGLPSIDIPPRR
jgi:hypothetical protein